MNSSNHNYCRKRCYAQVKLAGFGFGLCVMSSVGFIAVFKGYIETADQVQKTAALCILPLAFVFGLFLFLFGLKDALFPANSTLAKSIRSQLAYPNEAPDVSALFEMVDRDIAKNGKWFGSIAIGSEWIFGDQSMRLENLRGAFYKTERSTRNNATTCSYILTLIDHKKQEHCHVMRKENDMMLALHALCNIRPEITSGNSGDYKRFVRANDRKENK